jgi:hypothetical protein
MSVTRWLAAAVPLLVGCAAETRTEPAAATRLAPTGRPNFVNYAVPVALTDLGTLGNTYLGYSGGLYPGGLNTMPPAHFVGGRIMANSITPRLPDGTIDPIAGKYVLLSIGHSNTTQTWCAATGTVCEPWSFMGQAAADPAVNHTTLVIANGAKAGQNVIEWDDPTEPNYDRVRDFVLAPAGLTEAQVQIAWVKTTHANPTVSLPDPAADALTLQSDIGNVVRAMRVRYPNLKMIFFSSRSYGGFSVGPLSPEPYAFESGFSVKWTIEAQITQIASGGATIDPLSGDLGVLVAPWLGWAAYTWADVVPSLNGHVYVRGDYEPDGVHVDTTGETKGANALMAFFKNSPHTRCWFLAAAPPC